MHADNLKKYYRYRVRSMRQYCCGAVETHEPEDIHQMRVENKRLRALFRLMGVINPSFDQKTWFAPFKAINRNSGALRDSHVQLDLLAGMKKELRLRLDGFELHLLQQEQDGWQTFFDTAGDGSLPQLREPALQFSRSLKYTAENRIEDGSRDRVNTMNTHLIELDEFGLIEEESMHDIRTVSKELYFTILIIQQCTGLYANSDDYLGALKKVHKALGNWHDYQVCLELLDKFFEAAGGHVPMADYYRLKELAATHRFSWHRKFESAFSDFIPFANAL